MNLNRLIKDPAKYLYNYAMENSTRLLPNFERVILSHPKYAALYAVNVMKHRWKRAELIIVNDKEASAIYINGLNLPKDFIKNYMKIKDNY